MLLVVCIFYLFSCKKSESGDEANLSGLLRVTPQSAKAKELFVRLIEFDQSKAMISQINKIGFVDWTKMVFDASSDASNPISVVLPICGAEYTSDLLMFQFGADTTIREVKLLQWSADSKDENPVIEKLKNRFLVAFGKQGLKIPSQVKGNTSRDYVNTFRNVALGKAEQAKRLKNAKSFKLIDGNENFTSDGPPPETCKFWGEFHYLYTVAGASQDVGSWEYQYQFRNNIIYHIQRILYQNGIQNSSFLDGPYFTVDFGAGSNGPGSTGWAEIMLTQIFSEAVTTAGSQMWPAAHIHNVSVTGNMACTGDIIIDLPGDPDPGGGGGSGGGGDPGSGWAPGQVFSPTQIDHQLERPCYIDTYNMLTSENCMSMMTQILQNVFGCSDYINLVFRQSSSTHIPFSRAAQTTAGRYNQGGPIYVSITLNDNVMKSSSKEFIMETLLHEIIHAYLDVQYLEQTGAVTSPPEQELIQHMLMGYTYTDMVRYTLQMHFPNLTNNEVHAMILGGLPDSNDPQYNYNYNQLLANYNINRSYIEQVIHEHKSGFTGSVCTP